MIEAEEFTRASEQGATCKYMGSKDVGDKMAPFSHTAERSGMGRGEVHYSAYRAGLLQGPWLERSQEERIGFFCCSCSGSENQKNLLWKCRYFYAVCNLVFISCRFHMDSGLTH